MARFLSPEWFSEAIAGEGGANGDGPPVVLEQVVHGGPDGEVVYRVEVTAGRARLRWPVPEGSPPPDLRLATDWSTSADIARGRLSAQRALVEGRLRVSGNPGRIVGAAGALSGLDPVPAPVRAATTYEN